MERARERASERASRAAKGIRFVHANRLGLEPPTGPEGKTIVTSSDDETSVEESDESEAERRRYRRAVRHRDRLKTTGEFE